MMSLKQLNTRRRIAPVLFVTACVAAAAVAATAADPKMAFKPVGQMSYPLWQDGCVLAHVVAINASVTAHVGESVVTKHGKWLCALVVADQATGKLAAAWIPASN